LLFRMGGVPLSRVGGPIDRTGGPRMTRLRDALDWSSSWIPGCLVLLGWSFAPAVGGRPFRAIPVGTGRPLCCFRAGCFGGGRGASAIATPAPPTRGARPIAGRRRFAVLRLLGCAGRRVARDGIGHFRSLAVRRLSSTGCVTFR
jgi:hypothetical protein